MSFCVELPLRIESVANLREHWGAKQRRTRKQREAAMFVPKGIKLPCTVKLTRIGQKHLDGDNLQSGFKALRDGIASRLGIDDNDPRVTWEYGQERGSPRIYAARIEISHPEAI